MNNHIVVERLVEHFLVCVFALFRGDQHTSVFEPAAEVGGGFIDVCCELLQLGVHVLNRGCEQELVIAVLANLVNHRLFRIPDDLVRCQRADGHGCESIEYLSLPVLVVVKHFRAVQLVSAKSYLFDLLEEVGDFLVVAHELVDDLDSVLVKVVRKLLELHRGRAHADWPQDFSRLNFFDFLLNVEGMADDSDLDLTELLNSARALLDVFRDRKAEPVVVLNTLLHRVLKRCKFTREQVCLNRLQVI
jgi:hypothetical protein